MSYDVEAIRKKLKQSMSGKFADPDEFRPEKAKSQTDIIKYRFFILPPLSAGTVLKSGPIKREMDQFFVQHANHWVNDKPHPCPRIWDGQKCDICQFGFDLLKTEEIKNNEEKKRATVKQWMPTAQYMMNIYFPPSKANPEDLRGRVMFYNAPKTVLDICMACLMRDDAGDAESPEAFGVFFDETNGFLFELQVSKQGRSNSYKTSKFLAQQSPMVRLADGTPDMKQLDALLKMRHDLYSKVELPDLVKIRNLCKVMVDGDDSGATAGGGFDEAEGDDDVVKTAATAAAKAKAAPKTEAKQPPAGKATAGTSAKTVAKKPAPVVTDDDDDLLGVGGPVTSPAAKTAEDPLADEAPLEETSKTATAVVEAESAPVNSSEINALLDQLGEDD